MLETLNDIISLIVIVLVIIISSATFWSINSKIRNQEESDEYYRDLL